MTMLEKVAKALYEHGYVGDWPPSRQVDLGMDADYFRAMARAAINAMREPTTAMFLAGSDQLGKPRKTLPECWRDMISAALDEPPPS